MKTHPEKAAPAAEGYSCRNHHYHPFFSSHSERVSGWPLWEGAKGQALPSGESNWADGPKEVTAHSTQGHRLAKGVQELKVSLLQLTMEAVGPSLQEAFIQHLALV